MSRRVLTLVVSLVSILAVFAVYFGIYGRNDRRVNTEIEAASSSVTLTDNADWTAGTNDNTAISADPGSGVEINDKISSYDMSTIPDENITTAGSVSTGKNNTTDGNTATYWQFQSNILDDWAELIIDIGSSISVRSVNIYSTCPVMEYDCQLWTSTNGVDYAALASVSGSLVNQNVYSGLMSVRYFKFKSISQFYEGYDSYAQIQEILVTSNGSATHTSATTQLDAGDHYTVGWTTFVPDDTIPANTSINYRFRTSTDAATWGSWTASTASAASIDIETLLGGTDAAKRYLQVETTLANTDGASTPTLDAYTANYDYTDATCSDGIQNGTETGVDCGGTCPACATCSDGIQNQGETGVDCGGPCAACPVVPTCSDGIQNGSETGVDCGGSCDACSEPPPPIVCPADGNWLDYCNNYADQYFDGSCSTNLECQSACDPNYTGPDTVTQVKLLTPNGGETYQMTKQMTINWVVGNIDLSKGQKTSLMTMPIGIGLSTDSGKTFNKLLEIIYPGPLSGYVSHSNNIYANWLANYFGGVKPYTSYHTYNNISAINNGYYSYTLTIPNADSLISSTAQLMLKPIVFGCIGDPPPDKSDNDFTILAGPITPPPPPICPGPNCPCIGDDCKCTDDTCVCIGSDCECSDPDVCQICHDPDNCEPCTGEACKPCVGDDCRCLDGSCECIGPDCDCRVLDTCHICTGPDCEPCVDEACTPCTSIWCKIFPPGETGNICIGEWCVAGAVANKALATLLAAISIIAAVAVATGQAIEYLVTATPRELLAILTKGKDKKHKPGVTYDADSGLPVPLAKVLLFRASDNKMIAATTSNAVGHFGLEIPPGNDYFIKIARDGFDMLDKNSNLFKSLSLVYDNNYFGQIFKANTEAALFDKSIPLVTNSAGVNYRVAARRFESLSHILRFMNYPLILIGTLVSVYALYITQSLFNFILCGIYVILIIWTIYRLARTSNSRGIVINQATKQGVDLAIVRAYSTNTGKIIKTSISDRQGKYLLSLPHGYYKIKSSKPGLSQFGDYDYRAKDFAPARTRIQMAETSRQDVYAVQPNSVVKSRTYERASSNSRVFNDSSEIIERHNSQTAEPAESVAANPQSTYPNWRFN